MKKIVLFGDSIRMGYDKYVAESWQGLAEVFSPEENCMHTTNILRKVHTWIENRNLYDADIVHWNAGLWDTVRIYGDGPLIKLDTYRENVERITKRLRFLFPKATIIFATSTPCDEDWYIKEFEFRYNSDIKLYNAAAIEVCKQNNVIINDLYSLLKDCPKSFHSDQTHYYTAEATELIGGQVNRIICEALNMDLSALFTPDKNKYENRAQGIPDEDAYVKNGKYYEYNL